MRERYKVRVLAGPDDLELEFDGGWAAGTAFYVVKVSAFPSHPELVGKKLCAEVDEIIPDGTAERCRYVARMIWSDGFIANTDDEALPYYEREYLNGIRDGAGTPMGGGVVPELDGIEFLVIDLFSDFENVEFTTVQLREIVKSIVDVLKDRQIETIESIAIRECIKRGVPPEMAPLIWLALSTAWNDVIAWADGEYDEMVRDEG